MNRSSKWVLGIIEPNFQLVRSHGHGLWFKSCQRNCYKCITQSQYGSYRAEANSNVISAVRLTQSYAATMRYLQQMYAGHVAVYSSSTAPPS